MDMDGLVKALELRFACTCCADGCRLRSYRGHSLLCLTYDTPWVPHTWEDFVRFDDGTRRNMLEFLRLELGISESLRDLQSVASVEKKGPYSYGSSSCHSGQLDYYCLDRPHAFISHRPNLHGTRTAIPGHPISH